MEKEISDIIAKAIATALDDREKQKDMQKWMFDPVGDERHTPLDLDQSFLSFGKLYGGVYQRYVDLNALPETMEVVSKSETPELADT